MVCHDAHASRDARTANHLDRRRFVRLRVARELQDARTRALDALEVRPPRARDSYFLVVKTPDAYVPRPLYLERGFLETLHPPVPRVAAAAADGDAALAAAANALDGLAPEELGALLHGGGAIELDDWRRHTRVVLADAAATADDADDLDDDEAAGADGAGGGRVFDGGARRLLRRGSSDGGGGGARRRREERVVAWFWVAVERFSPGERLALLRFATSMAAPPVGGFAALAPRFQLRIVSAGDGYPAAHTCFNALDLPGRVPSAAELARRLRVCLSVEAFGAE